MITCSSCRQGLTALPFYNRLADNEAIFALFEQSSGHFMSRLHVYCERVNEALKHNVYYKKANMIIAIS